MREGWGPQRVGNFVEQVKRPTKVVPGVTYPLLGVRWYGAGPFSRESVTNDTSAATSFNQVAPGDFIYNRLFAWKGSFGVVDSSLSGSYVSNEFPLFRIDRETLLVEYLLLLMTQPETWARIEIESTGSTSVSRNRWKEEQFLDWLVPVPPIPEQHRIVDLMGAVDTYVAAADARVEAARTARTALLTDLLSTPGEDWVETTLEEVASVDRGASWSKDQERSEPTSETMPVLRIGNVQLGGIDLGDVLHIDALRPKVAQRIIGNETIVMVGSNGNPKRIGNAYLASDLTDGFAFASFLIGITAGPQVRPALLCAFLQSAAVQASITLATSGSTGLKNIGLTWLRSLPIAIPPLPEQQRIVDLIGAVDTELETSEKVAAEARTLRTALLTDLLSGTHEIPASYDRFLEAA